MPKSTIAVLLLLVPCFIFSQPRIAFDTVVQGMSQTVDAVEVNDSSHRIFIVERTGKIKIWNGTSVLPTPYLDVSNIITDSYGEQGLLSLAFHPNYLTNGYFYIYYNNTSGAVTVARYSRTSGDTADPASGVVLMNIPKKYLNHNGGKLTFGTDGYLYFGTGDGGSGGDPDGNAQNGSSLLGKMLRIDVNNPNPPYYSIPPTNPYANSSTVKPEIIAIGLRNPWRYSFDKLTGNLWLADVGQDAWEEVNMVPAADVLGRNYGWKCFEGTHQYGSGCSIASNKVTPVFEYGHNNVNGGYSITGGYVYRGSEFPALQGYYLFTDFLSSNGWLTRPDGAGGYTTTQQTNWAANISSFSEAADGTLYALSLNGILYKIRAESTLPVHLLSFAGQLAAGKYELSWQVQNEESGDIYVLESRSAASAAFVEIAKTAANSVGFYTLKVPLTIADTYYRLKIISLSGQVTYSQTLLQRGSTKSSLKAYVSGKNLIVRLPAQATYLEVMDAVGKVFSRQQVTGLNEFTLPLLFMPRGIVTTRALIDGQWQIAQTVY